MASQCTRRAICVLPPASIAGPTSPDLSAPRGGEGQIIAYGDARRISGRGRVARDGRGGWPSLCRLFERLPGRGRGAARGVGELAGEALGRRPVAGTAGDLQGAGEI